MCHKKKHSVPVFAWWLKVMTDRFLLICMQGLLATLCASVILVNPIAKLAITMDPVGVAANTWAAGIIQGGAGTSH